MTYVEKTSGGWSHCTCSFRENRGNAGWRAEKPVRTMTRPVAVMAPLFPAAERGEMCTRIEVTREEGTNWHLRNRNTRNILRRCLYHTMMNLEMSRPRGRFCCVTLRDLCVLWMLAQNWDVIYNGHDQFFNPWNILWKHWCKNNLCSPSLFLSLSLSLSFSPCVCV